MAQSHEIDVLVIGSGPTGLTAANLLADSGLQVALIEKNPGSGDEPRAISATDETLRVMAHLGIMDGLGPQMLMDTGARYFGLGGKVIADVRPGNPRLGQPGKSQFDQVFQIQRNQLNLLSSDPTERDQVTQDCVHGLRGGADAIAVVIPVRRAPVRPAHVCSGCGEPWHRGADRNMAAGAPGDEGGSHAGVEGGIVASSR